MNKLTSIFLLGLLLTAGAPTHAFMVDLDSTGTNATGVRDLDIGGTAYDVIFEFVQADTAGPCGTAPCDVFFGDADGAQAAVDAINAALNTTAAVTVGSQSKIDFFVPYATGTDVDAKQATNLGAGFWILSTDASLDLDDVIEYARFSDAAVVPIPSAAWLFGSALAILGWVRRRTSNSLSSL